MMTIDNEHGYGKDEGEEEAAAQQELLALDLFLEGVAAGDRVVGGQGDVKARVLDGGDEVADTDHGGVVDDDAGLGQQVDLDLVDALEAHQG